MDNAMGIDKCNAHGILSRMSTGEALKAARERTGESQAEFARRLGINQSALSRWETGRREPRGPAQRLVERVLAELNEAAE